MSQIPDDIRRTITEHAALIQQLQEADFGLRPRLNKWSKKEILGHLIDSAQNNLRRFITVQYEMSPPHIVYDQDFWVSANDYNQVSKQDLILLWKLLNEQIARVLEKLPSSNLEKLCNTGKQREELHPVSYLAADYLTHLRHHLEQLVA
jgi:hypothetical protein